MQVWVLRTLFTANKLLIALGLDTPQKKRQEGDKKEGQVGGDVRKKNTHKHIYVHTHLTPESSIVHITS